MCKREIQRLERLRRHELDGRNIDDVRAEVGQHLHQTVRLLSGTCDQYAYTAQWKFTRHQFSFPVYADSSSASILAAPAFKIASARSVPNVRGTVPARCMRRTCLPSGRATT